MDKRQTLTRDAATGPTLTGGRAEAVWPGGGRGVNFTPVKNLYILRCASRADAFDIRSRRASGHGGTAVLSGIHQLRQF